MHTNTDQKHVMVLEKIGNLYYLEDKVTMLVSSTSRKKKSSFCKTYFQEFVNFTELRNIERPVTILKNAVLTATLISPPSNIICKY